MHKSGAFTVGDKISRAEIADVIPFALRRRQRRTKDGRNSWILARSAGVTSHKGGGYMDGLKPGPAQDIFGQIASDKDKALTDPRPAFLRPANDLIQPVGNTRTIDHRLIGRHGPRGSWSRSQLWRCRDVASPVPTT